MAKIGLEESLYNIKWSNDIIVNADDYGKNENVTRAITDAFAKKLINRTTIMVNMPYAVEAAKIARNNGFFDNVGVHLNLTEGMPITEEIKGNLIFCDENGCFNKVFYKPSRYRIFLDKESCKQVYNELAAQLDMYGKLGFTLWHVDSHHHIHWTHLPILIQLVKLKRIYPIKTMRLSRNMPKHKNVVKRMYVLLYNVAIKIFFPSNIKHFGSAEDYRCCKEKLEKDFEIMVHPEYDAQYDLVDDV